MPEADYINALLLDLQHEAPRLNGRVVESIFIGGGTPSLFAAEQIARLIDGIKQIIHLKAGAEITLEANPGTVDAANFLGFCQAGVNRLSIGVQSFSDEKLQALGRIHDADAAYKAFEAAKNAQFKAINIDLMFALPKQTTAQALADLDAAIALNPQHLSWYQLTLEPNTLFHHHPPPVPDDDAIWQMQQQGMQHLANNGYQQYEISAYAQTGWQCEHNLNYWQFGDYVAIGAGAHGKISHYVEAELQVSRYSKLRQPNAYLQAQKGQHYSEQHDLDHTDLKLEFMLNALRLNAGFDLQQFTAYTGLHTGILDAPLAQALDNGWIEQQNTYIQPTAKGLQYLNELLLLFML
jgi:oxygen-independent coproporphyrinogen-3 oxidase